MLIYYLREVVGTASMTNVFVLGDDCVVLKSGKDSNGRAFARPTANVLIRNLTLEACSCFKHSSGGLHGGLHWYDGCGGLKVGTEMSGGIVNVTFEDSHIGYSGAALKMLSPKGRGGYIKNVTWSVINACAFVHSVLCFAGFLTGDVAGRELQWTSLVVYCGCRFPMRVVHQRQAPKCRR